MKLVILFGMLVLAIWEFIFLPKYVEKKISNEVEQLGGKIATLQLLSRRECIYSVGYVKDNRIVNDSIKYNLFAKLTWI